jgi:hypothetical protein
MVRGIGILVACALVGVCVYLYFDRTRSPCECVDRAQSRASSGAEAPRTLSKEAVLLASILVGDKVPEGQTFRTYHQLCVAMRGGLGGVDQCSSLIDTDATEPH